MAALRGGLHGAGAYAAFVVESLKTSDALSIAAVSSRRPEHAREFAADHGIIACDSFEALIARDDIDVVLIATTPADHAPRAMSALAAGKHVISEKPLATTVTEAEAILAAARDAKKIVSVDYPMPYTDVVRAVNAIAAARTAGELRRVAIENIASCEALPDDHWFWDPAVSGGILIEHGVHFFDWCGALLGRVETVDGWAARSGRRQDRMAAMVGHVGGALATYYHAFIARAADERTRAHLAFDSCDAHIEGWIPIALRLSGRKAQDAAEAVRKLQLPTLRESTAGEAIVFDAGPKARAYANGVRSLAADFAAAVRSRAHRMTVDGPRALESLRVAAAATDSAAQGRVVRS